MRKRVSGVFLAVLLIFVHVISVFAYVPDPYQKPIVSWDGERLFEDETKPVPIIINDKTYVPMDGFFEAVKESFDAKGIVVDKSKFTTETVDGVVYFPLMELVNEKQWNWQWFTGFRVLMVITPTEEELAKLMEDYEYLNDLNEGYYRIKSMVFEAVEQIEQGTLNLDTAPKEEIPAELYKSVLLKEVEKINSMEMVYEAQKLQKLTAENLMHYCTIIDLTADLFSGKISSQEYAANMRYYNTNSFEPDATDTWWATVAIEKMLGIYQAE